MHTIIETDDGDAVLLIDVSNAFNALNRAAALHNINLRCPTIAIYAINTYRQQPTRLFVIDGKENITGRSACYGSICLQAASSVKQYWFADDASGAGSITEIMTRWDTLSTLSPDFGHFPNDRNAGSLQNQLKKKVSGKLSRTRPLTVHGQKHLGAVIGSREYLEEYVSVKVTNWIHEIAKLAEVAT